MDIGTIFVFVLVAVMFGLAIYDGIVNREDPSGPIMRPLYIDHREPPLDSRIADLEKDVGHIKSHPTRFYDGDC